MQISIITVNYNDKLGLERTLASVQEQTSVNHEHIIIDGGSTDGSRELIESHQNTFSYWVSESDRGIYHAMNKGIEKATGYYILFLNSGDDFSERNALKKAAQHLFNEDFVCFDINVISNESSRIKTCPELLTFEYLCEDTPPHQSTFIKRNLFNKFGFYDEKLKIASDWKFFILAVCKGNATYKHITEVFSNFYRGGISSLPQNRALLRKERDQVLETDFSVFLRDHNQKRVLKEKLAILKTSRKIQLLIKLGLINKF